MPEPTLKSLLDHSLTEPVLLDSGLRQDQVEELFRYFQQHPLFRWRNARNDCEDRSNAICILLDHWKIPNYKAWVFTGSFLNRPEGYLRNSWNFHVAPLVAITEDNQTKGYVLDPATLQQPDTISVWADKVTETHGSVHFITSGEDYIFTPGKMEKEHWFQRNRQNYKWTIQGLSGINGVSPSGKAQLVFCKAHIATTEKEFKKLFQDKPSFLH
jgi:hypothetical protein